MDQNEIKHPLVSASIGIKNNFKHPILSQTSPITMLKKTNKEIREELTRIKERKNKKRTERELKKERKLNEARLKKMNIRG